MEIKGSRYMLYFIRRKHIIKIVIWRGKGGKIVKYLNFCLYMKVYCDIYMPLYTYRYEWDVIITGIFLNFSGIYFYILFNVFCFVFFSTANASLLGGGGGKS